MRIATWNIGGGHKMKSLRTFDYEKGFQIDYFANILHELSIDIVCIQESQVKGDESVAKLISEVYGKYYVYESPISDSHTDKGYKLSLAVLSKYPINKSKALQLPYPTFDLTLPNGKPASRQDKYMQIVNIEDYKIANIFNQPMEFLGHGYDTELGKQYTKELTDFLNKNIEKTMILAGDFNDYKPAITFANTLDNFNFKNILPDTTTKPHVNGQFDCIFISDDFASKESKVIKTETDHYLCWADIKPVTNSFK